MTGDSERALNGTTQESQLAPSLNFTVNPAISLCATFLDRGGRIRPGRRLPIPRIHAVCITVAPAILNSGHVLNSRKPLQQPTLPQRMCVLSSLPVLKTTARWGTSIRRIRGKRAPGYFKPFCSPDRCDQAKLISRVSR